MAGIDTVTTFFDQLDNMEAEFRLHNLGYLVRILQIECHIRIFRYQLSPAHKAEFTTTAARTFIFLTRMQDEDAFKAYHTTILDAIQRSGAAVSHHHGIGKMFAPWLEGYIGEKEYGVFRVLKDYFDPDYNMNPGGTIGLDLKPEEKKFLREYTDYLEQPKFD